MHGFQIWVNLPARDKMIAPRYQEVPARAHPEATHAPTGSARVRVIAGEALGARAVIDTHTPIVYQDWTLAPGADVDVPLPREHNALRLRLRGRGRRSATRRARGRATGSSRCSATGERAARRGGRREAGARLLLLAGVPLREPVARYGPFVMNTESEIVEADPRLPDRQDGRDPPLTRFTRADRRYRFSLVDRRSARFYGSHTRLTTSSSSCRPNGLRR